MVSQPIDPTTHHLYTRTKPNIDGREGCIRKNPSPRKERYVS